jgi:hypothetical protein
VKWSMRGLGVVYPRRACKGPFLFSRSIWSSWSTLFLKLERNKDSNTHNHRHSRPAGGFAKNGQTGCTARPAQLFHGVVRSLGCTKGRTGLFFGLDQRENRSPITGVANDLI